MTSYPGIPLLWCVGPLEQFVSSDIFSDTLNDGAAGSDPNVSRNIFTLSRTLQFTSIFFFANGLGPNILCPLIRGTRVLISAAVLLIDLVARLAVAITSPGNMDTLIYDWFFDCPVPAAARSFGYQNLQFDTIGGSSILAVAADCADTDGVLVAFVQLFRCPCEWLGDLTFGPLKCLCGSTSYTYNPNSSAGAGILTSFSEFLAEVARVMMVILRRGLLFNGTISISGEIVTPIMVATTRAIFASSCIMVSIFGDTCSQVKWRRVVDSFGRILFSIPFFLAGILDRTMQKAITVSESEYKGGMTGFSFTGYNNFLLNNNDPAQCNPNVNPRGCGRSSFWNQPTTPDPGQDGAFTFVAQLIFPMTQIVIDVLEFLDCAIESSLDEIPGGGGLAKFASATVGGLIEMGKMTQSVFFSVLYFAWQMFELLTWVLTRDVGGWSKLLKAGKQAYKMGKTILRALSGHPADSHNYYGYSDLEGALDECESDFVYVLYRQAAELALAEERFADYENLRQQRDNAFSVCLSRFGAGSLPPETFNYLRPNNADKRNQPGSPFYGGFFSAYEARQTLAKQVFGDIATPKDTRANKRPFSPETIAMWKDILVVSKSIDANLYDTDPFNSIAAMASRFNQDPCRHENIIACICPWEPEIAMGTDLCAHRPGGYTLEDEKHMLQRAALFTFNGNTSCDDLVLHLSLDDHWEFADYAKKEKLARCLNDRAIGVHYAKELCAHIPQTEMCMWPRDLWYQEDRWAAWLKAQAMADAYDRLQPAHLQREKARLEKLKGARNLWQATRVPPETWNVTDAPQYTSNRNPGRRNENLRANAVRDDNVDSNWNDNGHWGTGAQANTGPSDGGHRLRFTRQNGVRMTRDQAHYNRLKRHRELRAFEKTGDLAFLQQVRRNLTRGEYDRETTDWLEGRTDMPLDIRLRPHGPLLLTHVVTYGSPCLLPKPEADHRSQNWRRGEYDGDARFVRDLRTGDKADLDNYMFEHYNRTTLSGYRIPSAAHRRELFYALRGWEAFSGMTHQRNLPQHNRRSVEDNLSTFGARRDARLLRVAKLARRVGAVGPVARDVHNIDPRTQQVTLDGAMAIDYLVYGAMSGAFKHGIERHNAATAEETAKAEPTAWQYLSNTHVRWQNDWAALNHMMRTSGSLAPGDLPSYAWNTTYSLLTSVFGAEEDPSIFKASRRARHMASPEERPAGESEGEEGSSEFRQRHPQAGDFEAEQEERAARIAQEARQNQRRFGLDADSEDHPVGLMDILASSYRSSIAANASEPLAPQSNATNWARANQALQRYTTGPVTRPQLRHRAQAAMLLDQMERYSRIKESLWAGKKGRFTPTHEARFIFGGGCQVVTNLLNEYLRVWSYCATHTPTPVIPPPAVRDLDAQMAIYYPVTTGLRGQHSHVHVARQAPRQASPGASAKYGPVFTELERIAKALDYLQDNLLPWLGSLDLAGRLETLFANSNGFWTNTNTDPDAGPVGFLFYFREFTRCDFPDDTLCERGVGAVQAVKDLLLWNLIAYGLVGYFLPWSIGMPILMVMPMISYGIFSYHAWRYSPYCMTYSQVPMCAVNELNNVIKYFFRTCYEDVIPSYWVADGNVCPPRGTCIDFIDCRNLEINSGWAVIAGALRVLGKDIFGRFVSFVESFAVFGTHGPAPQAAQFLRATSNTMLFAGDELVRQQNVCLVLNSAAVVPTAVSVFYGLILLGLAFTIGGLLVQWAATMAPLLWSMVRFVRPEVIPGTGDIQEPIMAVDD